MAFQDRVGIVISDEPDIGRTHSSSPNIFASSGRLSCGLRSLPKSTVLPPSCPLRPIPSRCRSVTGGGNRGCISDKTGIA